LPPQAKIFVSGQTLLRADNQQPNKDMCMEIQWRLGNSTFFTANLAAKSTHVLQLSRVYACRLWYWVCEKVKWLKRSTVDAVGGQETRVYRVSSKAVGGISMW